MKYFVKAALHLPKAGALLLYLAIVAGEIEYFEKDLGKDVYIEASREGYKSVDLRCKQEGMEVVINTDDDFEGVIYTRGSYMDRPKECFLDPTGGVTHKLTIPLDKCKTKKDENGFHTNTIILQHDDWLIFPGDAAFTLQCKYDQEETQMQATVSARLGLADPDPSAKDLPKHKKSTVQGETTVTFTPQDIRPKKKKKSEEL